jgi:spermidine synthase
VALYALTIFSGAFLLFLVQPLIGKFILPWFGGGPGVWTTCMLVFQVLLLFGYAYAHWSTKKLKPRVQVGLHIALLALALACLPIIPADHWKPSGSGNPMLQISLVLAATIGLPFFVLSSTGPMLQWWFSFTKKGVSPYRLYSLSNVGSLLALFAYPFYLEPHLSRKAQAWGWSGAWVFYAVLSALCGLKYLRGRPLAQESSSAIPVPDSGPEVRGFTRVLWLLLPACASALLLATTNKLCQDVAVIPFLWILPLAVYLLSFIVCFDNPRWYSRAVWVLAFVPATAGLCWMLREGDSASLYFQVFAFSFGLLVCSIVCHGELYRLRPPVGQLTQFYLMIAAGGVLGAVLVAVGAPLVFSDYFEFPAAIILCATLLFVACWRDAGSRASADWKWISIILPIMVYVGIDQVLVFLGKHNPHLSKGLMVGIRASIWTVVLLLSASWFFRARSRKFQLWRPLALSWLGLAVTALIVTLLWNTRATDPDVVYRSRNFYGRLTVYEHEKNEPENHYFLLLHGRITHGLQFANPPESSTPTTYYTEESGVGLAIRALPERSRRLGLIGLGTGTLAAYGRAGDYLRIYEINPAVPALSKSFFSYLRNSPAQIEVVPGDARLSLDREPAQNFDLLAIDAFSSDSIPVHLITREAFDLYERHLAPEGIIAVHISNHYLDLQPVVLALARAANYHVALIDVDEIGHEDEWWVYGSTWMLLSRSEKSLRVPSITSASSPVSTNSPHLRLWTDDFASVFQILK